MKDVPVMFDFEPKKRSSKEPTNRNFRTDAFDDERRIQEQQLMDDLAEQEENDYWEEQERIEAEDRERFWEDMLLCEMEAEDEYHVSQGDFHLQNK